MNITKEQLKEYIQVQKKVRGIELIEEVAVKEAQSLLLFVKTILKTSTKQKNEYNNSNIILRNGKTNYFN
jgi:hypothetical protein